MDIEQPRFEIKKWHPVAFWSIQYLLFEVGVQKLNIALSAKIIQWINASNVKVKRIKSAESNLVNALTHIMIIVYSNG
ncbi:hypothetical protein pb186bvf_004084 [Paramecium bursaria]